MDFLDRISLSHRYLRMLINTNTDPLNVAEPFFVAFFFFFLGDSKQLAASTTHNAPLPLSVQTSGNIHFVVQRFQTECLTYNAFGGPTTGTQTLHDFLLSKIKPRRAFSAARTGAHTHGAAVSLASVQQEAETHQQKC